MSFLKLTRNVYFHRGASQLTCLHPLFIGMSWEFLYFIFLIQLLQVWKNIWWKCFCCPDSRRRYNQLQASLCLLILFLFQVLFISFQYFASVIFSPFLPLPVSSVWMKRETANNIAYCWFCSRGWQRNEKTWQKNINSPLVCVFIYTRLNL